MKKQFRPEIPYELWRGIDRFATAHYVNRTAAVNILLKKILIQDKWIKKSEEKV